MVRGRFRHDTTAVIPLHRNTRRVFHGVTWLKAAHRAKSYPPLSYHFTLPSYHFRARLTPAAMCGTVLSVDHNYLITTVNGAPIWARALSDPKGRPHAISGLVALNEGIKSGRAVWCTDHRPTAGDSEPGLATLLNPDNVIAVVAFPDFTSNA